MITVLHFLFDYSGEKRYSTELLAGLAGNPELDIRLVCIHSSAKTEFSIERADGYSIVNIPLPMIPAPTLGYNYAELFPIYIRLIDQYDPLAEKVIVHVNQLDKLNIGKMKLEGIDYRIVFTLHFLLEECMFDNMKERVFTDDNIGGVDKFIAVTRYGQNVMTDNFGVPPEKTTLIYNGIRLHHGEELDRERIRAKYGFGPNEKLILCVGTVLKNKGLFSLTKVFCEMSKTMPDIRLVIAGNGSFDLLFSSITANHSRVTVLGKLPPEDVHALYRSCDVGVMPSLLEQCSYVALEMMSHSMPFVATEIRGMGELFESNRIALTVPVTYEEKESVLDEDVLMQHLTTLIRNEALGRELGDNARREWEGHYTHTVMTKKTLEVYESLFK